MLRKITKLLLVVLSFLGMYFSLVPKVFADLVRPCPPGEYCPPRKPSFPQSGYELLAQIVVGAIIFLVILISLVAIIKIRRKNA